MTVVTPFTPKEAYKSHINVIPEEVLKLVNGLLAKHYNSSTITIKQNDVVDALTSKGFTRDDIFESQMLDFEEAYREQGWTVAYYRPGYNESGSSYWTFKPKNS